METEQEELLTKIETVLDQLPTWQKEVIWLDILNHYEERDAILFQEVGIDTQLEINRYIVRLRNKIRELCNGTWKPKHKGSNKKTLVGF